MSEFFTSKDAASLISTYGFALFPLHGVFEGKCTCGDENCKHTGKHPATLTGFKEATKDIEVLKTLWNSRKHLNVGIATGEVSGIFVIDIDGPEGAASVSSMVEEYGPLPSTLTSKTARGSHLIFKHPGKLIRSRGHMLPNVDVRGDGGYIVGPHSNHVSGVKYEFINPLEEISDAPQWLIDLVIAEKERPAGSILPEYQPRRGLLTFDDKWSEDQIIELLSYIHPDDVYDQWVQIGMAIKDYGLPFDIWNEWSSRGSKYESKIMPSKWNSFRGSGTTIGSLVFFAKQGGWKPQKTYERVPDRAKTLNLSSKAIDYTYDEETGEILDDQPVINKTPSGLFYVKAENIKANIDASDFVQGLLSDSALSVVYGESNCGKTFFMTDLAFHIAMGKEWREKRVEQGGVVYVALEGASGLSNRVAAFKAHYKTIPEKFAMVPCQVDFMNPKGNIDEFIGLLGAARDDMGSVRLVVIDTLARAIAGGDENKGEDMGMLVFHADRIRMETGAHVCFIHHSGKDKARGARGHSSLRAAVDTEIEIERDQGANYSTIRVVKQREMTMGEDMFFALERVSLGSNKFGEEVTSCIVMPYEAPNKVRSTKKMTAIQTFVYESVVSCLSDFGHEINQGKDHGMQISITYEQFRQRLEDRGFKDLLDGDVPDAKVKSATQSARVALKNMGRINFNRNYLWLVFKDEN